MNLVVMNKSKYKNIFILPILVILALYSYFNTYELVGVIKNNRGSDNFLSDNGSHYYYAKNLNIIKNYIGERMVFSNYFYIRNVLFRTESRYCIPKNIKLHKINDDQIRKINENYKIKKVEIYPKDKRDKFQAIVTYLIEFDHDDDLLHVLQYKKSDFHVYILPDKYFMKIIGE